MGRRRSATDSPPCGLKSSSPVLSAAQRREHPEVFFTSPSATTAHDWPVGNTCGRCAVGALGDAPLTSCTARVWHRAELLGLGTSGRAIAALHLVARGHHAARSPLSH